SLRSRSHLLRVSSRSLYLRDVTSRFSGLECTRCAERFARDSRRSLCARCGGPLFARYELAALDRDAFAARPRGMWRWREMMPVLSPENVVTLGEGDTPLLDAPRLSASGKFASVAIKDEGNNPSGSFKARGLSAAVSKAKELGVRSIALPTAGNAGGPAAPHPPPAPMA